MMFRKETYAHALARGRRRLRESPTPDLDARVLMMLASGYDHAALIAHGNDVVPDDVLDRYAGYLKRRREGEPVAYITRRQEFYGRDFSVGPGVLIPRPETEMLIDACQHLHARRILDLGTGSGCLLFSALLEIPEATGIGIDASGEALLIAERNRQALRVADRSELQKMRFSEAPVMLRGQLFDLILSNPPYIPRGTELPVSVAHHEPQEALFSGEDGLDAHREVAQVIANMLAPSGSAFIEIGHDQGESAEAIYRDALPGRDVGTKQDAAGHPRMVAVRPKGSL
ncbi:peptide chain release factor N(5)-glutamine methyltransferase [Parvularcula lutaonensis]|uniref:peptide chain release factor N(5)-glutamine methyltransferase n=1 Tax=Parvularcula lutaonensis TaxID=491923 RepID=A0ABV7M7G7_9PROT|nr:peptide chain release factor N(5)-glutamine methyltransferase [Parvularcula lutaonensis]GGY41310.1 release factor glutamine methyltransferase [Parvularcula lutaonensis]